MRIIANTLFSFAIGGSLLMDACNVPRPIVLLALFSVAVSAVLTNLMWIKSIGLVGIGGLSLVYSGLAGQNLTGTILTIVIAILMTCAVVLMLFADLSYPSKRKKSNEVSES
jgi:hypothetical protein